MSHSDLESSASGESQDSFEMLGKFWFYFVPMVLRAVDCRLTFLIGLEVLVAHVVST